MYFHGHYSHCTLVFSVQFTAGPKMQALLQKDGGLVDAAAGNSLHVQLAQGRGTKVIDNCPVNRLSRAPSGLLEVGKRRE